MHACIALCGLYASFILGLYSETDPPCRMLEQMMNLQTYLLMTHITCVYRIVFQCRHDRVVGIFRTKAGNYRRMDIIMPVYEEMPFCLISWTGKLTFYAYLMLLIIGP